MYSVKSKVKSIGELPPVVLFNLFDVLLKPILTYGSYVWGIKSKLWCEIDKVFLQYSRCILRVKATTSNVITTGEVGELPPITTCQMSALCFVNRLHHMSNDKLAKKLYLELIVMNNQGFTTWATDALKLVNDLGLDVTNDQKLFVNKCKLIVKENVITNWFTNLHDNQLNPILRTYRNIKFKYCIEPYLCLVNKAKYRHAIAKLRCSSHNLEIERCRHTIPKTHVVDRKCLLCNDVEDERHFVLKCTVNVLQRQYFFQKVTTIYHDFMLLDDEDKFGLIMTSCEPQCLNWLGKFLHESFIIRNEYAIKK